MRNDDASSSIAGSSSSTSSQHRERQWSTSSCSQTSLRTSMEQGVYEEKANLMDMDSTVNLDLTSREIKTYQKQSYINPEMVRDIIIGLSDGLTVPFALTAGLSGLDNAKIVVIGGLAELVSGAISMGVGGMLSAQAELDHHRYTKSKTIQKVKKSQPEGLESEIRSIFMPLGLSSVTADQVAAELHRVENEDWQEYELNQAHLPSPSTSQSKGRRLSSFTPQRGLTPLLMRMGEGLEEIEAERVWQSALTIGTSYFLGGFIPLLPYLFFASISTALFASIAITATVFLIFGVIKQKCTGLSDWKSLIKSAISTLAVGIVAAGTSWAIVRAMQG